MGGCRKGLGRVGGVGCVGWSIVGGWGASELDLERESETEQRREGVKGRMVSKEDGMGQGRLGRTELNSLVQMESWGWEGVVLGCVSRLVLDLGMI